MGVRRRFSYLTQQGLIPQSLKFEGKKYGLSGLNERNCNPTTLYFRNYISTNFSLHKAAFYKYTLKLF